MAFLFERKGVIVVPGEAAGEEQLMEVALEAGADDIELSDDGSVDVLTPWEEFAAVKSALEDAGLSPEAGEVTMIASTTVPVDADAPATAAGLTPSGWQPLPEPALKPDPARGPRPRSAASPAVSARVTSTCQVG